MKKILKLNLIFSFLLLSQALSFAQDPCDEVIPFASAPEVNGCCVTYVMDTSIGVNWILQLQQGDNPFQTDIIVTSHDNNGSNTYTHCYEPGSQTAVAFITYIDQNWNTVCESSYLVTLGACEPSCGFASEPEVDGCCVTYVMDISISENWILQLNDANDLSQAYIVTSIDNNGSNIVTHCFEPGAETTIAFITYADENWDDICDNSFEIVLEGCEPSCGFASEPEVDGCCVTYVMDISISENWILQLNDPNDLSQAYIVTSIDNNGSNIVTHCFEPGAETTIAFITYADENWVDICDNSFEIVLEGCGSSCDFASEPEVDGCCVTYVMDTSISENWILQLNDPNDLSQAYIVTSIDNNGSNIVTHCFEPGTETTIAFITYADENWVDICDNSFEIVLEGCGSSCDFASEPEVDDCCVTYVMDTSISENWILQLNDPNDLSQAYIVTSIDNNGSNIVTHCFEPGTETTIAFITYADENWVDICDNSFEIILEGCEPSCGFASDIVIDGCKFSSSVYSSEFTTRVTFYNSNNEVKGGFTINANPNIPTTDVAHYFSEPGVYTYVLECLDSEGNVINTITGSFTIEDCTGGSPRSNTLEENKLAEVNISPNPTADRLTINAQGQAIQSIKLFDINNRLLLDKRLNKDNVYSLDLSQIQSSGIYYLQIIANGNFYTKKVILQK